MLNIADLEVMEIPKNVLEYPSMMSYIEKRLLFWLAQRHFSGTGTIIDAGIFLGASTYAFARGVKLNEKVRIQPSQKPIHSYDIAVWARGMEVFSKRPAFQKILRNIKIEHGDDFSFLLRKALGKHEDVIDFRFGDIVKTARCDGPVEIAFYDCLKTNDRDLAAFQTFAPFYIPGHTMVVQQDYYYESAVDNKIRQEFYADRYSFIGRFHSSALFLVSQGFDKSDVSKDNIQELPAEQKVALLQQAAERADDRSSYFRTKLSVARYLFDAGHLEDAKSAFEQIESDASNKGALEDVKVSKAFADYRKMIFA